ncbi:MAG: hypothetical protein JRJ39_01850 [Deltaproteobacteria bacterium]|nr:hypothetical protein [Deltaproteobacteria bacterium]
MLGGYTSGCFGRTVDPSNTILDAAGESDTVLDLRNNNGGDVSIEGFTIQNGYGYVGGLWALSELPLATTSGTAGVITMTNNIVTGNTSTSNYGGVWAHSKANLNNTATSGGNVTLTNNTITGNTANGHYGGVCALSEGPNGTGTVTLEDNTITGNNATTGQYGGVFAGSDQNALSHSALGGDVTLTNNIISGNTAYTRYGGGRISSDGSIGTGTITLTNNTISENNATTSNDGCGGIYVLSYTYNGSTGGDIILANNTITGNTATAGSYGGVYVYSLTNDGTAGDVTLINNTITGNTANTNYGGVYVYSYEANMGTMGSITLTNNTISDNTANSMYGGCGLSSGATIYCSNNIIWGNTASSTDDLRIPESFSIRIGRNNDYSEIEGSWNSETGKIDENPLFVGSGDYHLQSGSDCIDAGYNNAPSIPDYDFEGDPRIHKGTVDIGADEYAPSGIISHLLMLLLN